MVSACASAASRRVHVASTRYYLDDYLGISADTMRDRRLANVWTMQYASAQSEVLTAAGNTTTELARCKKRGLWRDEYAANRSHLNPQRTSAPLHTVGACLNGSSKPY
jgi:hypothetical protein